MRTRRRGQVPRAGRSDGEGAHARRLYPSSDARFLGSKPAPVFSVRSPPAAAPLACVKLHQPHQCALRETAPSWRGRKRKQRLHPFHIFCLNAHQGKPSLERRLRVRSRTWRKRSAEQVVVDPAMGWMHGLHGEVHPLLENGQGRDLGRMRPMRLTPWGKVGRAIGRSGGVGRPRAPRGRRAGEPRRRPRR